MRFTNLKRCFSILFGNLQLQNSPSNIHFTSFKLTHTKKKVTHYSLLVKNNNNPFNCTSPTRKRLLNTHIWWLLTGCSKRRNRVVRRYFQSPSIPNKSSETPSHNHLAIGPKKEHTKDPRTKQWNGLAKSYSFCPSVLFQA